MSRASPEKCKPKFHKCGGPRTLGKCPSETWDTDKIFENKRLKKERYTR